MKRIVKLGQLGAYMMLGIGSIASAQSTGPAAAPPATSAPPTDAPPAVAALGPSLEASLTAARAAIESCRHIDQNVAVSVVDSAGITKVTLAADGATPRGVQSSGTKARTALAFQQPTSDLAEKSKSDASLAEKLAADPNYNSRAGGVLIKRNGQIIGAVGVGGAKGSEKDEGCAKVALALIK
jgi:uncharacterized protein GlcG (DUF336 family)